MLMQVRSDLYGITIQDSDGFLKGSKIHINPYTPKISLIILLTALHTLHIFFYKIIWFSQLTTKRFESRRFERLVEFSRFPELSRASGFFPGLFILRKCQNKILGISRFSRTCMNPLDSTTACGFQSSKYPSQISGHRQLHGLS